MVIILSLLWSAEFYNDSRDWLGTLKAWLDGGVGVGGA